MQCGYVAYEFNDFKDQLHQVDITHDQYTLIYYTLLGADHAHVAIGLLLDVWLLGKLLGGMTRYRRNALRAIALYWHGVNVLTLIVTLTVLSPSFS